MPDLEALSRARIGLLLTRGFEDLLTRPQLLRAARMVAALGVVVWVGWRLFQDWNAASFPAWTPTFPVAFGAVAAGAAGLLALPLLFVAELRVAGLHRPEHRAFYARIWLQGYFFRYVPGKVLLVAERVRLGSLVGLAPATSVVLVLWETLLLLVGACLLACGGMAVLGPQAGGTGLSIVGALVAAVVLLLGFTPGLRWLTRVIPWLAHRVPGLVLDVPWTRQGLLSLGYMVVWLALGASFALTCRLFESGADAGLNEALWFVMSYVVGLVIGVTPAGLGVREGLVVAGLSGVYAPATALAFALASRLLMTAVELVAVLVATTIPAPEGPQA